MFNSILTVYNNRPTNKELVKYTCLFSPSSGSQPMRQIYDNLSEIKNRLNNNNSTKGNFH